MTTPPPSVALIGFMASGKTTVGRLLAQMLGYPFVETDAAVESLAGCSIPAVFARHGEARFRDLESRVIQEAARPGRVIATGGGAVLRSENRKALRESGYLVFLDVTPQTVLARTAGTRAERPLLAVEDPLARVTELMDERRPIYAEADLTVAADERPPAVLADQIAAWYRRVTTV